MASKWMKGKEKYFSDFKEKKKQEAENQTNGTTRRSEIVWKTPNRGTVDKAITYILRLLSDKNNNFYKSYYYHMFQNTKGQWVFVVCPKTHNFKDYCPFCSASMKLYRGSKEDKRTAYNYKRKQKHCGNAYIIKDPRDANAENEEEKNFGKVLVYEFPDKVESKIKSEMNDDEYGNGMNIFDPGEDGVDFILKVGATKPVQEEGPNKGKQFPEYGDSKFANKPYPLSKDDKTVEEIVNSVHDLDAYLKSMEKSEEELIQLIKDEMLWDLISDDKEMSGHVQTRPDMESTADMDEIPQGFTNSKEDEKPATETDNKEEDFSEEDLLKELEEF